MEKPNGFHQMETSPERTMLTYLSLTEISDMEREIAAVTQAYLTLANERKANYEQNRQPATTHYGRTTQDNGKS